MGKWPYTRGVPRLETTTKDTYPSCLCHNSHLWYLGSKVGPVRYGEEHASAPDRRRMPDSPTPRPAGETLAAENRHPASHPRESSSTTLESGQPDIAIGGLRRCRESPRGLIERCSTALARDRFANPRPVEVPSWRGVYVPFELETTESGRMTCSAVSGVLRLSFVLLFLSASIPTVNCGRQVKVRIGVPCAMGLNVSAHRRNIMSTHYMRRSSG